MIHKKIIIFFTVLCTCISGFSPISIYPVDVLAHGEPPEDVPASCPHDPAPEPFIGLYLCDAPNTWCAAVASVFTWYATDTSVDAGYERAKPLFMPSGWLDIHSDKPVSPSTYDAISGPPPLRMVPIWKSIHQLHHDAIAYVFVDATVGLISVTQFEYPTNQVDHNGIPILGSHPIHSRIWLLRFMEGNGVYPYPPNTPYGHSKIQVLNSASKYPGIINDRGDHSRDWRNIILTPPAKKQSVASRWSCQGEGKI